MYDSARMVAPFSACSKLSSTSIPWSLPLHYWKKSIPSLSKWNKAWDWIFVCWKELLGLEAGDLPNGAIRSCRTTNQHQILKTKLNNAESISNRIIGRGTSSIDRFTNSISSKTHRNITRCHIWQIVIGLTSYVFGPFHANESLDLQFLWYHQYQKQQWHQNVFINSFYIKPHDSTT